MKKTEIWLFNCNETMRICGQHTGVFGGTKESEEIHNILNAYEQYGDSYEKLIALLLNKFSFGICSCIFTLGKMYGVREERQKKRKKGMK